MSDAKTDPYGATLSGDDPALARTMSADGSPSPSDTHDSDGSRPSIAADIRPSAVLTSEHPGRYRPQGEIGRGGMGRVLVAFDEHLGREVAMKELLGQAAPGDSGMSIGAVARFLREARITGQLEHPSIVPVHELGQRADGTIYYTMKRIRGRSLKSVLEEKASAGARLEVMSAFRDVCQAIAYAHARGVVHRDLKPENVMVGEFGETLVVDWGLAKVRGEKDPRAADIERRVELLRGADAARTMGGHAIGTPAYMSPEQARGDLDSIDERSDVWGLGAMLFEILTGRTPYTGTSALEVLQRVLEEPAPRVRAIAPDAPPELAAIADRALMKDPSSRYPGAKELADEIAAWQDGRTVRAYEYSSLELLRRFVKRNRAATVAAASILAASVLASVLVWRSFVSEQEARGLAERRASEAVAARERADDRSRAAEMSLAQALLERGERALREGDPAAAAIYAAATLARDPTNPDARAYAGDLALDAATRRAAQERIDRAHSLYADADAARGWAFERTIEVVDHAAKMRPDGAELVMATSTGLERIDLSSDRRTAVPIATRVERVVGWIGTDRVLLRGAESGVHDVATGARVLATVDAQDMAVVGDRMAVIDGEGTIVIYDLARGAELERRATDHGAHGLHVALSRDGARLAVLGRAQGAVDLWPVPLGDREPVRVAMGGWTTRAAFSPDGTELAVGLNGADVRIVSVATQAITRVPTEAWVNGLAWLDADRLAVLEEDAVVVRWVRSGRAGQHLHAPISIGNQMLAGGRRIVVLPVQSGPGLGARVFQETGARGRETRGVSAIVHNLVWDAARSRVVCVAGRDVIALELRRHRLGVPSTLATLPDGAGLGHDLSIAADGAIAVGTSTGAVVIVEPDGAARTALPPITSRTGPAAAVVWDHEGVRVLAAGREGETMQLRRAARDGTTSEPITTPGFVLGLAISHDGRRIASSETNGDVRILDAADPSRVVRVLHGHETLAAHAAFSPDDRRIATVDGAGSVRVFEVDSGRMLESEQPHADWINRVGWSDDGRQLVTASDDGTVRVLASDTLRTLRILRTSGSTMRAELTREGELIAFDGARVIVIDAVPSHTRDDPEQLLAQAERRAGVRLEGMQLVAAE